MRHNLPPTPAFRDALPTDPVQEIALRVVAELPKWEMDVLGTATLIGAHLAITAKHVLDYAIRKLGAKRASKGLRLTDTRFGCIKYCQVQFIEVELLLAKLENSKPSFLMKTAAIRRLNGFERN